MCRVLTRAATHATRAYVRYAVYCAYSAFQRKCGVALALTYTQRVLHIFELNLTSFHLQTNAMPHLRYSKDSRNHSAPKFKVHDIAPI